MKSHTGLRVRCDNPKCAKNPDDVVEMVYPNEHGHADYIIIEKAIADGWFLPLWTGKDLCPKCHRALAAKVGRISFYIERNVFSSPLRTNLEETDKESDA